MNPYPPPIHSFNQAPPRKIYGLPRLVWCSGLLRATGLLALLPASAPALVVDGTAGATAANVDVSLASLVALHTGDLGGLFGDAPPAFTLADQGLPINASAGVLAINLASITGVGNTAATSTVNNALGGKSSGATGQVVGLALSLADLPPVIVNPPPLLQISASTIGTTCGVSGDSGELTAEGNFTATNLVVKVSGTTVNLNLPTEILPNTSVNLNTLGLAGVVLHLNEQSITGDGIGTRAISCVALRVEVSALSVAALGLINGSVIVGESSASLASDADGDGVLDGTDLDSDNDGVPDSVENAAALNGGDTDNDGVPDFLDLDSDNDGILDVNEAGHAGADTNNDGRIDGGPAAFGANGLANVVETTAESGVLNYTQRNTDGDGRPDRVDLDSDNDSISDLRESGDASLADGDHNGLVDGTTDINGLQPGGGAFDPVDTDGDLIPDNRDPDRRNDGVPDIADNGFSNLDPNGDGRIDNAADTDLDGIPNVLDSQPGVFGGFPLPEGFPAWDVTYPADTDGDVFPRDQEYAFGGLPTAGTHRVDGTVRRQGLSITKRGTSADGVDVSFVRPKGRYDAVYTLYGSEALEPGSAAWTAIAVNPVIADNGDNTETLTWADAGALTPLTQDRGFVRLNVVSPASPAGTYTLVEGWSRTLIEGGRQTYGVNFPSLPVLTGIMGTAAGNTVNLPAAAGGINLATILNVPGAVYYLEVTDGTAEGHRIDVSEGGIGSVGLNLASANNTTATLPAGLAGSHFVIRKHRTLGEIFVRTEWNTSNSIGSADQVHFFNGTGFDVNFNRQGGGGFWSTSGGANANDKVIGPGVGLFVTHAQTGDSNTQLQVGDVRYNDFRRPLTIVAPGQDLVTVGYPVSATPAALTMTTANLFVGSNSSGSASQIQIWNGDLAANASGYKVNILRVNSTWRSITPSADVTAVPLFQANRSAFLLIRQPNQGWTHPLAWDPSLWQQP